MAEIALMANSLGRTNGIFIKNKQTTCPCFLPALCPGSRQVYEKLPTMKRPEKNDLNCEFPLFPHLLSISL